MAAHGSERVAADALAEQPRRQEGAALSERTRQEVREIIARYPQPRSALLPMLHLVQSEEGYVSAEGIALCAEELGLTKAEVGAVATFYTMYRRKPAGEYHVGVCTNTLCAVLGGDEILASVKDHLGIGHNETTEDGRISLEHIECNAACDYAPVVMVNWEFYDNQTPASTRELVDACREGNPPPPTRGPSSLCTFKQASRVLAGFRDGRGSEGVQAGPPTLVGLEIAKQRGDAAPAYDAVPAAPSEPVDEKDS
jgi:NADH-quinone oxidoreductase subunit E